MKLKFIKSHTQFWKLWEQYPAIAWVALGLWVVGIGGMAFCWNLGSVGLVDETEPLFAEAARQMTVTGDWLTPYFNGQTRFDKPPLIYWLMAIAYQGLGVNTWAARLPSALAAIALVALLGYTLRQFAMTAPPDSPAAAAVPKPLQPWLVAWIGTTVLTLNPLFITWARTGVSDMLLTACMDGSLLAFFCGYAQADCPPVQRRWYFTCYGLIALAILTKGPVGIVLPGLIISSFVLYVGQGRAVWREMQLPWGGY
ncbi:ArnT family glycosyltransferase [Neosynechococcus sphagnicola]|uniref:ArnT family glycosyltransferase n=1 Tax=Neosynechococcus sphagnicola TaxID=1501145 RepID=UPI000A76F039|nr:hypothetical protein [Neosynechococcus sphagnicola]